MQVAARRCGRMLWRASAPPTARRPFRSGGLAVAMAKPWRPDLNDVDRLSKGGAATKRRGTGSFNIAHRLSAEERPVFEGAKKKGWLAVRGTGFRKGRGNPLPNIWRQWCDAKGVPCVVIEQDTTGAGLDVVVLDLSPLRRLQVCAPAAAACELARQHGARQLLPQERALDAVPFNTQEVALPQSPMQLLYPAAEPGGAASGAGAQAPAPTPEQLLAAEQRVLLQAELVRSLKAQGMGNSDPQVQQQVQALLGLKSELQALLDRAAQQEAGSSASSDESSGGSSSTTTTTTSSSSSSARSSSGDHASRGAAHDNGGQDDAGSWGEERRGGKRGSRDDALDERHPYATTAIWGLPVLPLFFECDRPSAKELAKALAAASLAVPGRQAA